MNIQDTKRIAEVLGLKIIHLDETYIVVNSEKRKAEAVDFEPNCDFAIMRMIEKLQSDGWDVVFGVNRTWVCLGDAINWDECYTFESELKPNKGGLAEVFLQVYGNGGE